MRFSTPIAALIVLLAPSFAVADWPASGSDWGAASTPEVTTTYIAQTTVTMTLLQVQTATVHYGNATSTSSYSKPSPSVDVSATPSVCLNCNVSTGDAYMQSAHLGVVAIAGLGALVLGSL